MRHVTHLQAVTESGTAKQRATAPARTDAEVQRAITRADAALGAAGTVSGDEAAARIIEKLRHLPSRLNG